MTGVAVQQSAAWSPQERTEQQQQQPLARFEPTNSKSPSSVMDAWLRKLRLHHHSHKENSAAYASPAATSSPSSPVCESQQKRKHPSFIKALFKPHEHKAIKNSSPEATSASSSNGNNNNTSSKNSEKKYGRHSSVKCSSNQALDQEQQENESQRVVPPVEIPSMYLGRSAAPGGASGCSVTVGGRRVPFTRDAHRCMMKKRAVKALACIAEARAFGSSNKDAYRSLAYYPAPKQRKEKR